MLIKRHQEEQFPHLYTKRFRSLKEPPRRMQLKTQRRPRYHSKRRRELPHNNHHRQGCRRPRLQPLRHELRLLLHQQLHQLLLRQELRLLLHQQLHQLLLQAPRQRWRQKLPRRKQAT